MATETTIRTTRTTTASLILATFALVGILTTGAVVPAASAQLLTGPGALLDEVLAEDGQTGSNGGSGGGSDGERITDGPETTRETTTQTEDQSERNSQTNALNIEQTANNNAQTGSGDGSEVASAANSESDSECKIKDKSKDHKYKDDKDKSKDDRYESRHDGSKPPIECNSTSESASAVSTTAVQEQNQTVDRPTLVNTNDAGTDESRSAVVGFDLGFESFTN
jgi:hypothetical protein